jgi:Iron-sulfur cluster assembly protein
VEVDDGASTVDVLFTPTIPHCSMATLIGLCIRVKLLRSLPPRFKVHVSIAPGTHASEHAGGCWHSRYRHLHRVQHHRLPVLSRWCAAVGSLCLIRTDRMPVLVAGIQAYSLDYMASI